MLFASTNTAAPADVRTDETSIGPIPPSSDAHRSFCDLFEEDGVLLSSSANKAPPSPRPDAAVAEPPSATAPRPTSTENTANRAGGITRERMLGTGATSRFFEGAVASVRRGLVGRNAPFRTPYGMKPLVYSDWTATGRAVGSIEVCIHNGVERAVLLVVGKPIQRSP